MRAVAIDDDGRPHPTDVPEPDGDAPLVHVRASGLCGSDVEKLGRVPAGTVLGHEVVGEDAAGRRVALVHHLPCGDCERCRAGHESTCTEFRAATIEPGGFAEKVRARAAVPLPDGVGDVAGTFAEPLACVLRAAERVPRGRVLVAGCGFVGLLFAQVLISRGDDVVVTDVLSERLELARSLGAGPLAGTVASAVVTAPDAVNDAIAAVDPGGTLVVFAAHEGPVPFDLGAVYRRELTVVGSRSGTPRHLEAAVALLPEIEAPPTVVLPLERFEEGLELYRTREAVKVVFVP